MSKRCDFRAATPQRGFILAATLWVIAAIAIGVAYFAEQVNQSRDLALQAQRLSATLIDMEGTRAEILFRIATTEFSVYGIGESSETAIRLDDRPYLGIGKDVVRLQDNRGLVNLNFPLQGLVERLLGQLGVPAERRGPLMDALLDYVDTDDLRRLNGAESREYGLRNLPPPANDWLTTPWELQNVAGWRNELSLWKDWKLPHLVTTARVIGFDPNTAPREVLESLPGSSPEIAQAILDRRRAGPLISAAQWADLVGSLAHDDGMMLFPSTSFRVSQQEVGVPWMLQYSVTLTPSSGDAPWRVDYFSKVPVTTPLPNDSDIPPLPERPASAAAPLSPL